MTRRFWILWLMLALLPWRGWAASVEPTAMAGAQVVAASTAHPHAAPMPRCHESADANATPSHPSCCVLCDLCHGTVASVTTAVVPVPPVEGAAPPVHAARDTGRRLVGGLDRPPRSLLI